MAHTRLDSWKSIAEYLDRSVRSVQRWHVEYGLPVFHLRGDKGSVFAYPDQLDNWLLDRGATQIHHEEEELLVRSKVLSERLITAAQERLLLASEENLLKIAMLYRRAAELDPRNPFALTELSKVLIYSAICGSAQAVAAYADAGALLSAASRLNVHSTEAKCVSAWLSMMLVRDWNNARAQFNAILVSQPKHPLTLLGSGLLHLAEGDLAAASSHLVSAWSEDPLNSITASLACWGHYLSGEYDRAIGLIARLRARGDSGRILTTLEALTIIQLGSPHDCISHLEGLTADQPDNKVLSGVLGYAYGVSGMSDKARSASSNFLGKRANGDGNDAYPMALTSLGLGQTQGAIHWIEESIKERSVWSLGLRFDPLLVPLRREAEFESLLR